MTKIGRLVTIHKLQFTNIALYGIIGQGQVSSFTVDGACTLLCTALVGCESSRISPGYTFHRAKNIMSSQELDDFLLWLEEAHPGLVLNFSAGRYIDLMLKHGGAGVYIISGRKAGRKQAVDLLKEYEMSRNHEDIEDAARNLLVMGFSKMNAARNLSATYGIPLPKALGLIEEQERGDDAPVGDQLGEGQSPRS